MLVIVISALSIVIDQFTKYLVEGNVSLQNVNVIDGFFHLTYVKNTGMAWSLLSGQQALLSLVSAVAIGVMIWYLLTNKTDTVTKICIALMIGGAAGNLIDRLFIGAVRDFLDFYIFGYNFPIFNVADSCLCVGVALLIVWTLISDQRKKKEQI